jgi:hypothetical protein
MAKTRYRLNLVLQIKEDICNFVFVGNFNFTLAGNASEIPLKLLEAHITRDEAAPPNKQRPPASKGAASKRSNQSPPSRKRTPSRT